MPSVVLTSVHDNLVDYVIAHGLNPNVVVPLINQAAAEAIAGWGITSILVSEANGADAFDTKATTRQYSAAIVGTGEYSQAVTWSITGNVSELTTISDAGLLTVNAQEFVDANEDPVIDHSIEIVAISVENGAIAGRIFFNCATEVFSVTYEANGGTGTTVDASSPYASGAEVTVETNNFTPPANTVFEKWSYYADGSGVVVPATFEIADNTVLYAIWKPTWTVAYRPNTGTGTMTDASSPYEDGEEVTVKANTFTPPTDKLFLNWNTAEDGSGTDYDPSETLTIEANISFYAQWKDTITSVTVKNAADGTSNGTTAAAAADIQFYATVAGAGTYSRDVTWSMTGHGTGSFISNNGLVTLAAAEFVAPAVNGHTINVIATSVADPTVSDTEVITCTVA